jgi:hypothetical protein
MAKFLYEVRLQRGRDNPEYKAFLSNANNLNAKAPDYGGISSVCLVSHSMDIGTVRVLFEEGMKKSMADLSIEEITKESLVAPSSHHKIYTDMVNSLYLKYDSFPNIQ